MLTSRRLAWPLLLILLSSLPLRVDAQVARIADFIGEWVGSTSTGVDLKLRVDYTGTYALHWLTGPGAGSAPTGATTLRDNNLVVKYRDGEMVLTKRPDGSLTGPYVTSRSKGTVSFSAAGTEAQGTNRGSVATGSRTLCEQNVPFRLGTQTPTAPADAQAFSGTWLGRWNRDGRCIAVIVENINREGIVRLIWVEGALPGYAGMLNGRPGYGSPRGIAKGGVLQIQYRDGTTITLKVSKPDELAAKAQWMPSQWDSSTLKRQP